MLYLKQRNQFRLNSPKYLDPLESDVFHDRVYTYILQPETEELRAILREVKIDQEFKREYRASKSEEVDSIISNLKPVLNQSNYFSIYNLTEYWFAKINTSFVAPLYERILEIDGDGFYVYDQKFENGFCVDIYEQHYSKGGESVCRAGYEIGVWGEDWTRYLLQK